MSTTVTLNGINYAIPSVNEIGWGTELSSYLIALGSGAVLSLEGNNFPLLHDVNFGPNYGVVAPYFISAATNPAHSGLLRLANTDSINFRNSTNTADIPIQVVGNMVTIGGAPASTLLANNTQSGDYTLQLSDTYNTLIRMTSATLSTVTIPNDSSVAFPIGTNILISWNGIGPVAVAGASGVTVITPDTLFINKKYGKAVIMKTDVNYWEMEGNLEPST